MRALKEAVAPMVTKHVFCGLSDMFCLILSCYWGILEYMYIPGKCEIIHDRLLRVKLVRGEAWTNGSSGEVNFSDLLCLIVFQLNIAPTMAAPFKRICLQTSRQRAIRTNSCRQWLPARTIYNTPVRLADELQTTDSSIQDLDPMLDELSRKPGVKYTVTEEAEDLKSLDVDNMSSLAHRELEQHKELREMVRIAAWEMPLLSHLSKPFQPPREDQVLKWRYTTYMGEPHPAARKVVVEFQPSRIPDLNTEQVSKLQKLAGARYNPSTQTVKMSCESFETQAQNKRYLADTISKLIAEAQDLETDSFADVPLDTRHHKPRARPQFPKAWILTPERKKELEEKRRAKMLEEGEKVEQDKVISGIQAIEMAKQVDVKKIEEPVMASARAPVPKGKMGKKEMGQRRGQR